MTLPHRSQPARTAPQRLLVYLHGAGETGGDTERQLRKAGPWTDVLYDPAHAYGPAVRAAIGRFHVLGFHLPSGDWDGAVLDDEIAAYLGAHPEVDRERLYLTGLSRGGRGVLRLALHRLRAGRPVTAVASFCPAGGAEEYGDADIALLRRIPILFIHSPEDDVVPFDGTATLLQRIGSATAGLRVIHPSELADPAGPHNCWTQVYACPDLYAWLDDRAPDPADWPRLAVPRRR